MSIRKIGEKLREGIELTEEEKLEFDKYYIQNRGFKLDLLILIKTIMVIFTRHGAR